MEMLVGNRFVSTDASKLRQHFISSINAGRRSSVRLRGSTGEILEGFFVQYDDDALEAKDGDFVAYKLANGKLSLSRYTFVSSSDCPNSLAKLTTIDGRPVVRDAVRMVDTRNAKAVVSANAVNGCELLGRFGAIIAQADSVGATSLI